MVRIKQTMQCKVITAVGDGTSDSGDSDDEINHEERLVVEEQSKERGFVRNEDYPDENVITNGETDKQVESGITIEKNDKVSLKVDNLIKTDKMTLKMENSPKTQSDEKSLDVNSSDSKTMSSDRPETPPLKRLMRQDPLPLFMNEKGPSPSKKIFREDYNSKIHNISYLSSAHASLLKHVPTHPKQAMLKVKHYSNKLQNPYMSFNMPKMLSEDQPLDLSKKGSSKSSSDYLKKDSDETKKSPGKYTNGFLSNISQTNSSLQSLQKRFGGEFPLKSHRHPMSGMLINIPPSFLPKSNTSLHVPSVNSIPFENSKKNSKPQSALNNSANRSERKSEKSDVSDTRKRSPINTDLNSNVMSKPEENLSSSSKEDMGKHTIHKCSCQKAYNTLYGLSLHLQETGHLPAGTKQTSLMEYPKLVRGQDMWLNQESEQTKRILRCIQCGESFKSLPMLTVHMMQTQHYTKIVSSEHGRRTHKCSAYCDRDMDRECIFKCKVCNGSFNDMEGLANHMILSGHHKKNMLRSHNLLDINLRGKRKRFTSGEESLELPGTTTVASLLEYKRKCLRDSSSPLRRDSASPMSNANSRMSESPISDVTDDSRITCENCDRRIETGHFVEHVRECLSLSKYESPYTRLKIKKEEDSIHFDDAEKFSSNSDSVEQKSVSDNDDKNDKKPIKLQMKLEKNENDDKEGETEKSLHKQDNEEDSEGDIHVKSENKDNSKDQSDTSERELKDDSLKASPGHFKAGEVSTVSSKKKLDIIDPNAINDASQCDGNSALQAMESFIQKSFSSKFNYRRNSGRFLTQDQSSKIQDSQVKEKKTLRHSSLAMIEKYQKYFGDIYRPEVESEKVRHAKDTDRESPLKDDLEKLEKMCEKVQKSGMPEKKSDNKTADTQENSDTVKSGENGESLCRKYISLESDKERSDSVTMTSSSALDSLSSFVYGQPLTSEHPLDSLQKLLTKSSSIPKLPSNNIHKCIPRSTTPDVPFPLNLSLKKEADDETDGFEKDSFSDQDSNNSESESEINVEYRCAACSRHFASKGSYRYHLSRCHLSSVKKYGIKEAFNMSPYIYLPLDHTAKFSKYYEMAQELANKGK